MDGAPKLSLAQISAQIRALVRKGAIFFSTHALEEMANDRLDLADMLAVLGGCRIVQEQPSARYQVEGRTSDGTPVIAVCRVEQANRAGERVFVITVWKVIKK